MPITPVTQLPDPPSRKSPTTFAVLTDAFLAALPAFVAELNSLGIDIQAAADYVATAGVGPAGTGIQSLSVDGSYHLIITLTDSTVIDAGLLPAGADGYVGADGAQGPKGDKGDAGAGLTILGQYATYADLAAAHPTALDGNAYLVGSDLYIWFASAWNNTGPLQGPKGDTGATGTGVSSFTVDVNGHLIITLTDSTQIDAGYVVGPQGNQGIQGIQGIQGAAGKGIASVTLTNGNHAPGTTDTYTITYTDSTTSTFTAYNGADGLGAGDMLKSVYDPDGDGKIAFDQLVGVAAALGADDNYVTGAEKTKLANLSGTNSGDQDLSGLVTKTTTVNGHALTGNVAVTASDVGLGNVNNTADADKPISTATATALSSKADLISGVVPASQLPSYVDDVLEYANLASFPATGESGKIYVAIDTNITYRWSGSTYVEISASLALGETSSTSYRGDRGKAAYDHSQSTGNPHGLVAADIGAASTSAAQTFTAPQRGTVLTDNDLSFDMSAKQNFSCTPTGSGTLTFTNITAGQSGFIYLSNTTNYTISKHSAVKCGASLLSTISVTGSYLLNYFSPDGTNVYVTASGALS